MSQLVADDPRIRKRRHVPVAAGPAVDRDGCEGGQSDQSCMMRRASQFINASLHKLSLHDFQILSQYICFFVTSVSVSKKNNDNLVTNTSKINQHICSGFIKRFEVLALSKGTPVLLTF